MDSEEISPYINVLVQQLVNLIEKGSNKVKEQAISGLQSLASCAATSFKPFFAVTIKIMAFLMQQTSQELEIVRSRATECAGKKKKSHFNFLLFTIKFFFFFLSIKFFLSTFFFLIILKIGAIALAVGYELFEPYENSFVQLAASNFLANGENACELREYSYGFFTHLSFLLEGKFSKYLSQLVPIAIKTLESEDYKIKNTKTSTMDEYIEADSDEDEELDTKISVRTAFLDEQSAAIHSLGAWVKKKQ